MLQRRPARSAAPPKTRSGPSAAGANGVGSGTVPKSLERLRMAALYEQVKAGA